MECKRAVLHVRADTSFPRSPLPVIKPLGLQIREMDPRAIYIAP